MYRIISCLVESARKKNYFLTEIDRKAFISVLFCVRFIGCIGYDKMVFLLILVWILEVLTLLLCQSFISV